MVRAVLPFAVAVLLALPAAGDSFIQGSEITPESVLAQMNFYRGLHGEPPLRIDARLSKAAEDRMRHMEEQQFWAHESPSGASPFMWLTLNGYSFSAAGENLASGFETAEVLVRSWMESRGHRRNILAPQFDDVGIAVIEGAVTRRATGRSVVVLFARERGR
jgi:uncharacterized protein YkwD